MKITRLKIFIFIWLLAFNYLFNSLTAQTQDTSFVKSCNVSVFSHFYKTQLPDTAKRQAQLRGFIDGDITVGFDDKQRWTIPISWTLSLAHTSFEQLLNRIGASPVYEDSFKKIQLKLGWNTINTGQYLLNNRDFWGLGTDIKLCNKKLLIEGFYGRLQKAVPEETLLQSDVFYPQFSRTAYTQIGLGGKIGYKDIIGITFLKAQDAPFSTQTRLRDTLELSPQANAAIGLQMYIPLSKSKQWSLRGEVNGSVYTGDTFQKLAFIPIKNIHSQIFSASELTLSWNASKADSSWVKNFSISYKRIDRDYKTMGVYFLQTDIEQIMAHLACKFGKTSPLSLNLSGGWGRDNLKETKLATSHKLIINGNINWQHKNNTFNIGYTNFGIKQTQNRYYQLSDTIRFQNIAQNVFLSDNLYIAEAHRISFNATYTQAKEHNPFFYNKKYNDYDAYNLNIVYEWTPNKIIPSIGLLYNKQNYYIGKVESYGFETGLNIPLDKFMFNLNYIFQNNRFQKVYDGKSHSIIGSLKWLVGDYLSLGGQLIFINNQTQALPNFKETYGNLNLNFNF